MSLQNSLLWFNENVISGLPCLLLLLFVGITLTVRLNGLQVLKCNRIISALFKKNPAQKSGVVSPFQATCTALAGTVGTGNIVGVASALALGGPGAVFWMWLSALLGMAIKFSEITLGVLYRRKLSNGEYRGGPMYYISFIHANGKLPKILSAAFCIFGIFASFGIGNMTQVNTVVRSFESTVCAFGLPAERLALPIGMILAAITVFVCTGGARSVGKGTARIVPVMSLIYVVICATVLIKNHRCIPKAFQMIFRCAFSPKSVLGGGVGITFTKTFRYGIGRGIFSNEAGLGSASIAHASAETDSPVKQGFFGIIEIWIDTLLICTLTAVTLLCAHLSSDALIPFGRSVSGTVLMQRALESLLPPKLSGLLLTIALLMFALSSLFSWNLYGVHCIEFVFGKRAILPYQLLFACGTMIGSILDMQLVWELSELLNGLMMLPNLIGVLLLSGTVAKVTKEFFRSDSETEITGNRSKRLHQKKNSAIIHQNIRR